jgi:hypothetical protein
MPLLAAQGGFALTKAAPCRAMNNYAGPSIILDWGAPIAEMRLGQSDDALVHYLRQVWIK